MGSFADFVKVHNKKKAAKQSFAEFMAEYQKERTADEAVADKKDQKQDTVYMPGSSYLTGGSNTGSIPYAAALQGSGAREDDIAPVKEDKQKWYEGWLQKGALEDGYQFGDVLKTTTGTIKDLRENLLSGVLGIGEAAVDAGAYLAGGVGKLLGADQFADKTKDFISRELVNEEQVAKAIVRGTTSPFLDPTRKHDTDDISILGEKSDSLVQSGGQLLGTMGLQAAGVPWFLTSGVTSFGGEAENALKAGASYEEAGLSAAITAGAEILTEKISGGIKFGGNTLDDALTKKLAREVSDKFLRNALKFGLDFTGEGLEEVMSENLSRFGQWLTYQDEESLVQMLWSEEAMDEKIQAFLSGGLMGGGSSAVNVVKSAASGVDAVSGLTQNEQKVVDKVYKDAIEGKDLSQKEKAKIYDDILERMDKGYISTDTIEEVLGGESYKTYKNAVDSQKALRDRQKALQEEFKALNQMKHGDITGEQTDRRTELKEKLLPQIRQKIAEGEKHTSRDQLSREVSGLVKGSRLAESYAERGRRGEKFQADVSQYAENQRATVQAAIDSGVLNNTNRSHELVDFVAKLAADKGLTFDFANNEKLKETGFALEGVTVNGFVNEKGVTVNIQSAKALNAVVGHEITHVLEGTQLYDTLAQSITEYAKAKGEYQSRYDRLAKLYAGVENANVEAEVVADLVGDYLFTDKAFVQKLSTQNRSLFKKIWDEVKYLCKVVTAGSKEAKQLLEVKKIIEEAYRAETKNTVVEDGVRYALASIEAVTPTDEQKMKNIQDVAAMESVYSVDASKLVPGEKSIKQTYQEYFDEWGGNIHSDVFGDIAVKNSSIRSEMRHGSTPVKVASIEAIPSVIQNGKIVEWMEKDAGLFRIVVAAPIEIGGIPYYMGVMLQRDAQNQRLYLHDVVIEKEASNLSQEHLDSTGPYEEHENLYTSSILDKIVEVKRKMRPNQNSLSERGQDDIAPLPWQIKGQDVALEDFAPIGENVVTKQNTIAEDELAPVREDVGGSGESTNAVSKPLNSYPAEKQRVIRSYLRAVDERLKAFVESVKNGDLRFKRQKISDVSERTALDIGNLLDVDVIGYTHNINTHGIQHILNRHGANGKQDTTMSLADDIARLGWVLENYDSVELLTDGGNQISSSEFLDKKHNPAPQIRFVKKIDGSYYVVEAVFENDYRKLWVQSAYLQKKEDVTQSPAEGQMTDHGTNAQSAIASPSSNDSIFENGNVVNPDDSTGAAPSGFDPVSHLQYEYGSLPEGENAVREDSLPKSTNGKDKVSLTARTVKGAEATPDELVDLLDQETVEGKLSYIPIKNDATVQAAYDSIVNDGWEVARGKWEAEVRAGKVSAELSAKGALLLNNAAKAGDKKAWLDILHDYQIMGTNAGQAVQALRILKTLSPDDSLYMIRRSISQMVQDMKLGADIQIDDALAERYTEARTESERTAVRKEIAAQVARQIPSTAMDKWTALRYLNMLGNLRTQGRNILGNVGMSATSNIKNTIAAGIEWLAEKASGGKFHRTKSLFVNSKQLEAAKNDFANVEAVALNGGKFNDPMAKSLQFQQEVQDARKIFKFAPLERYRKGTNWSMDKGDLVFSKAAYARSLAGYLKAQGITETDYSKIDQQVLDEARAYAIKEAQETTFRDSNWLSDWVSKMGRRKDTPAVGKALSEGIMPFRKTPANILIRAEEYSPLGLVNATVKSIQAAKGKVTGAEVVNSWAKALTGTGLFGLGMLLNSIGALSGGPDEDDDKEWFEDQYGWQNYAVQIGDVNFTIDFLSPEAMPLLMGAQLMEMMQDGGIELKEIESALLSIADPMIEMSMLQGVNDTLENIQYAESNMGQFVVNACLSYLTQGLTNSFLGQVERSFEGQRMSTYVDKDSDLPDWLQKALGKASAKTPGWDYNQMPYINAWGEEEESNPLFAALENMLSPSYVEQGKTDAVYEELNRLNDTQSDINVYPQTPDKTLTFDDADGVRHEDYNLSKDEYVELAKLQGQTQKRLVEEIISSKVYGELTDREKAKAIQLAYQYARDYSRQEVLNADGFSSKWMAEAGDDIVEAIIAHTNDERTFAYDYPEKYAFFRDNDISYDTYAAADEEGKRAYTWAYEYPEKYTMSKAISDDFLTYWRYKSEMGDLKADKDSNGKTISGSKKEKVIDYINNLDLDYGQKIILFRSMYDSQADREAYNSDILEYLNSREDISYEEMVTILTELGFTVRDGWVTWD